MLYLSELGLFDELLSVLPGKKYFKFSTFVYLLTDPPSISMLCMLIVYTMERIYRCPRYSYALLPGG